MKWYQKAWVIILFLLCIAPVGIFLMWKYQKWGKNTKIAVAIVSSIIFIVVLAKGGTNGRNKLESSGLNVATTSQPPETLIFEPIVDPTLEMTPELTAEPTEEPTKEPTTEPTIEPSTIELISMTTPVQRNSNAFVEVKGIPDTKYTINVYYSSGVSNADGLEEKTSDLDGVISWEWKIGGQTGKGDYFLRVTGGGTSLRVDFSVE